MSSHEERARIYFNTLKRVRMLTKVNEVETLAHQFRQVENAAYERAAQEVERMHDFSIDNTEEGETIGDYQDILASYIRALIQEEE